MNSGVEQAKKAMDSIGAVQTLVENFPMKLLSLGELKFATSFDLLIIILKMIGIDRDELIEKLTKILSGNSSGDDEGKGFVATAEEIVKLALEANIINILNCTTNPIINNNLIDSYDIIGGNTASGEGITLSVSEIDFTGVLNKSPLSENGKKFYFDVDDKNVNNLYESKDFNAFLWYIINKSDRRFPDKCKWDDRYKAGIYKKGQSEKGNKKIINCSYIDENYPNMDKIRVHLCRETYYKTRSLSTKGTSFALNKTIFEFNHDFLSSIRLYNTKVIIAEIVEYFFGSAFSVNLGFSINEDLIKGKIDAIIEKVIKNDDKEINDCYFTFSNEEYNDMLEKAERNRFNIIKYGDSNIEMDPTLLLNQLDEINSESTPHKEQTIINNVLNDIIVTPGQNSESNTSFNLDYDWQFELMRMLVYPFIRPLFTPKVIFLLLVNKKIMGSLEDVENIDFNQMLDSLLNSLFIIIKDIILKLKNMLIELFLNMILEKLAPLLALFASRLLLETLNTYLSLLRQLLECFKFFDISSLFKNNNNSIDNVNYADIINNNMVTNQIQPNQNIC